MRNAEESWQLGVLLKCRNVLCHFSQFTLSAFKMYTLGLNFYIVQGVLWLFRYLPLNFFFFL